MKKCKILKVKNIFLRTFYRCNLFFGYLRKTADIFIAQKPAEIIKDYLTDKKLKMRRGKQDS